MTPDADTGIGEDGDSLAAHDRAVRTMTALSASFVLSGFATLGATDACATVAGIPKLRGLGYPVASPPPTKLERRPKPVTTSSSRARLLAT